MSLLKLKANGPTKPLTPMEFFTTVCPAALGVNADVCRVLGGTYGFQLLGNGGGAWTLDYASSSVQEGILGGTDLYIEMDAAEFAKILNGRLDVKAAATNGRIRVDGDVTLFSNLLAVLEPMQA